MNTDGARHDGMADLARLVPAPAERDLPWGRHHVLKEHLMSEVRLSSNPPAGTEPARSRRRPALVLTAMGAAVAAAFTAVALLPAPAPAGPSAVRLLAKVADAAASQPAPHVRDNQFWYIRSQVSNGSCGVSGCTKVHERQIWQSVSNMCVTGLLRESGQDTPLIYGGSVNGKPVSGPLRAMQVPCPNRGGVGDPTYRFLQTLPTSPRALLSFIEQHMGGELPRPVEAFTAIGDTIRETIAPPQVSAALYRAAALIPGVTVIKDATDAIGRHGIAVAQTYQGVRSEWIFSTGTHRYLGERDISTANGTTTWDSAIIQRAFVDHAGQTPR